MAEIISHGDRTPTLQEAVSRAELVIAASPPDEQAQLTQDLADLQGFELGRWLLMHGGLNGRWTRHCVLYPRRVRAGAAPPENAVERFYLQRAPVMLATQQRFEIFQSVLSKFVKPSARMLSVPCGTLDDLLTLDVSRACVGVALDLTLIGIDLDHESLRLANENARSLALDHATETFNCDAWSLTNIGLAPCDVVTSNGLAIYESDDARVVSLYEQFGGLLKDGGTLVTSTLVPPSDWDHDAINPADQKRAAGINALCAIEWNNLRSVDLTTDLLAAAGLSVTNVLYDKARIFPTVVAVKQ